LSVLFLATEVAESMENRTLMTLIKLIWMVFPYISV